MRILKKGDKAPDFDLPTLDGAGFRLSQELVKGPVAMTILKQTCPTCRLAMPLLDQAANSIGSKGSSFFFVLQEMPMIARSCVDEFSIESKVAFDEAPYPVSEAYGISFVPTTFLISSEREVLAVAESFDRDGLTEIFDHLARSAGLETLPLRFEDQGAPVFKPG